LTRDEAAARAAQVTDLTYRIELDLTAPGDTFTSRTTIRFASPRPGGQTFLDLIAPQVHRVTLNGRELAPADVVHDARIELPGIAAVNEVVVQADCAYSHTGEGLHRFTDPVDGATYLYTQFEPADARRVYAVFEQPDLKGRFEFVVTAPAGWKVLSNQPVASTASLPDGAGSPDAAAGAPVTHRFEPTPVIAPYLTALAAGPWAEWHSEVASASGRSVPMAVYARQSLAQHVDADQVFAITKAGFGFYEPAFAYPYPYAKYDQVFCPEYNFGAMENVGLVTITESYIFRSAPVQARVERRAITILHELAHMWFGDLVTMRWWNDLWLNESFAEFMSHWAATQATEWTDAWTTFTYAEKNWAYRQDQLPTTHPIMAPINDLDDVQNNFDGITYAKGASVLRQLVAWVGEEAFLAGVRSYFKKYAWGNTELADLLRELAAASGRELASWSELWLETAGVATLRTSATVGTGGLAIVQTAPADHPTVRPHRLGVGGYRLNPADGALTRQWRVELDVEGEATALGPEVTGRPADLLLLNDGDLAYAKVRLDPVSLETAAAHVADITDPLARAVVWGSLWDCVRDAEIPARAYVATVLDGLGRETNSAALQTLLGQVATGLTYYVAPEARDQARAEAAQRLWALLTGAPPGSDTQLQFVKAYAQHAWTTDQLRAIDGLLDGSGPVAGVSLDTDLTWELLHALVVGGLAGEDRIAAQLEADPTLAGREQAARLQASLPTAEAKAAAWLRAVSDPATPNATQRHIIAGFTRVRDRSLLAPYVEPYFEVLEQTWRERSPEIAGNIAEGLYPSLLGDDPAAQVLERTEQFLAGLGDRLPPLRRLVVEGQAGVTRALAAQARDRKG
jgi:aminopeptidase N